MHNQHLNLIPSPLKFIENKLLQSVIPYASMQLSQEAPSVTGSKIAGLPFLPINKKLPVTSKGQIMQLLIQINFAEIPLSLNFPQKGILQVFIDPYYLNNVKINVNVIPKDSYEVRFYPNNNDLIIPLQTVANVNDLYAFKHELNIEFRTEFEPISSSDYRLNEYVSENDIEFFYEKASNPFEEIYAQYFLCATNKVGGYPYFIQKDIRQANSSLLKYDTLIFQLVSNDEDQIMIGNCGVIKFFINKEDLLKQQFTDVLLFVEDYT